MKRRTILQAPALLCLPKGVRAQSFPTKPIRYIVPVAAGGGNDMIARVVTERWGKALGQNFIVENQGGGGGVIASVATARAVPDGYTLMQGYVATHGTTPATRKVPYDAIKDFTPIGMIGGTPNVLVVNSALPVKTLAEFIAYAKQNPGKLNYGSSGQGSTVHILTESFRHAAGIDIVHIPYRGAGPSLGGLLAGDIEILIDTVVVPHIQAGRLLGLAAAGDTRLPELPELPTLAELGLSSVRTSGWTALFAPAQLPRDILDIYTRNIESLFKDEAFVKRIVATGSRPAFLAPAPFAELVRQDHAYFGNVIRELKIRAQD